MVGCDSEGGSRALITTTFLFQDLVANGALVSICNKYGEMPVDKAKAPLRELLRGLSSTLQLCSLVLSLLVSSCIPAEAKIVCLSSPERAEKMGQNLNRIPYKDTFWKGTTRTRPSESVVRGGVVIGNNPGLFGLGWEAGYLTHSTFSGNGTLNKHSGIDFKQLNFLAKLNENHSGEVTPAFHAPPSPNPRRLYALHHLLHHF